MNAIFFQAFQKWWWFFSFQEPIVSIFKVLRPKCIFQSKMQPACCLHVTVSHAAMRMPQFVGLSAHSFLSSNFVSIFALNDRPACRGMRSSNIFRVSWAHEETRLIKCCQHLTWKLTLSLSGYLKYRGRFSFSSSLLYFEIDDITEYVFPRSWNATNTCIINRYLCCYSFDKPPRKLLASYPLEGSSISTELADKKSKLILKTAKGRKYEFTATERKANTILFCCLIVLIGNLGMRGMEGGSHQGKRLCHFKLSAPEGVGQTGGMSSLHRYRFSWILFWISHLNTFLFFCQLLKLLIKYRRRVTIMRSRLIRKMHPQVSQS